MSDSPSSSGRGSEALDASLREIDPDLNIFALANGLDLHRNLAGTPDRVLGWYREGMERFLRLEPEVDGTESFALWAEAVRTREGTSRSARREVRRGVPTTSLRQELRAMLAQGIESANALGLPDLDAEGSS